MELGSPTARGTDDEPLRQISWRDPDGFVVERGARIFRCVAPSRVEEVDSLIGSQWFEARVSTGSVTASRWVPASEVGAPAPEGFRWLEHERLPFPCYPHEITGLQLYESAQLTLDLALEALDHGWMLKDCSAWNVLFSGGRPVFCDVLSFVRFEPVDAWPAYGQFQRHFIIPLLLYVHVGMSPSALFLSRRDGATPESARRMLRGTVAWRQPALEAVTLPAILARAGGAGRGATAGGRRRIAPDLALHLLNQTLKRLSRHLKKVHPSRSRPSRWAQYEIEREHYTEEDLAAKRSFVRDMMSDSRISTVLDLGCNAGEFSFIAEGCGKEVVAADNDEESLEALCRRVRERRSTVQALYLDVGRPTPSVGWMGTETPGVLERMAGQFDCVLMLGLIHHLLVSERATFGRLFDLLCGLRPAFLVVEWVEPHDPRFSALAGIHAGLYSKFDRARFESELGKRFSIQAVKPLPSRTRILYACERISAVEKAQSTQDLAARFEEAL